MITLSNVEYDMNMREAYEAGYEKAKKEYARPQGEWEEPFEHNGKMYHKCNHCHISSPFMLIDNYCSYCGAEMQKGGKEE